MRREESDWETSATLVRFCLVVVVVVVVSKTRLMAYFYPLFLI
jgi:phage shock protein PspC (stress-responsive transcriptional regulator)